MNVLEIYLKTTSTADEFVGRIALALGLKFEKRFGENRGGEYFEAKLGQRTFELLVNRGEVRIPERADWTHYLFVHEDTSSIDAQSFRGQVDVLASSLRQQGIEAEVDSLS